MRLQQPCEEDVALLGEKSKYPKPHKHDIISCLGFSGKWVTSHPDLQLDPPDCQQLFLRNASVSFLFPQAWTLMYAQHGRYQHVLLDIMEKLEKGILKCKIAQTVSLDDAITVLKNLEDVRVGKVVLKICVDEIVLSYVLGILESLGTQGDMEDTEDVEQFAEMMEAYLPGFAVISM
nr:hypothetical protein BaRGS_022807 [Batillaria attramentaria]